MRAGRALGIWGLNGTESWVGAIATERTQSRYGRDGSHVGSWPFASRATPSEDEKKAAMTAPNTPLTGDALLVAVTEAMVELHERYHHRAPASARTQLMEGDLMACVLGGVYTDVEKTMIEIQRCTMVQETRSDFQHAMEHKFIEAVERQSGAAC